MFEVLSQGFIDALRYSIDGSGFFFREVAMLLERRCSSADGQIIG